MKASALIATLLGLALAAVVLVSNDTNQIVGALASLGQAGFAWVCCFYLILVLLCALAMQALIGPPRPSLDGVFWSRLCRNAGNELLAIFPAVGELLAIRVLAAQGMAAAAATAAVVVDVTVELTAQFLFSLIGLLFAAGVLDGPALYWCAGALAFLALVTLGCFAVQHRAVFNLLDALAQKVAPDLALASAGMRRRIQEQLAALWMDRGRLSLSTAIHLGAWILGVGEAWIALVFMGLHPPLEALIALESLVFAVRSIAFVVPGAIGIQEGAYASLAAAFGLPPEAMLAVSLIKRGRSIAVGIPVLIGWQLVKLRRLHRQANKD